MNTINFLFHSQISNYIFRNCFDNRDKCVERMWKRKKYTKNDSVICENQKFEKKSIENFYDQQTKNIDSFWFHQNFEKLSLRFDVA